MDSPIPESHPLHRLFRGLAEHTFGAELGMADPPVVSYVANLLARFVPSDNLFARGAGGQRLSEVAALLARASEAPDNDRRRECLRHVGDYTLFWTGVFPEAIPALEGPAHPAPVVDWQQRGKWSYYLASTFGEGEEASLLRRLSAQFELCAYGLSRVRREWESLPGQEVARDGARPPILGC
jgi:hypothetical protein